MNMNMRKTSMMILKITIRMVVIAAIVAVFYVVCRKTFDYGAAIFSEEAMAEKGQGQEVVVTIPYDTTTAELGKILVESGLIEDAGMFNIQAVLYELEIYPGTYQFSTEQNVEEIIEVINTAYWEAKEAEEAERESKEAAKNKAEEKQTEETQTEETQAENEEDGE